MKIQDVKLINKGALIATCSVQIPEWKLTIREISLFQKGDNFWTTFPSRKYEKDGKTKYYQFFRFDNDEITHKFQKKVKELFDNWISTQQLPPQGDNLETPPF